MMFKLSPGCCLHPPGPATGPVPAHTQHPVDEAWELWIRGIGDMAMGYGLWGPGVTVHLVLIAGWSRPWANGRRKYSARKQRADSKQAGSMKHTRPSAVASLSCPVLSARPCCCHFLRPVASRFPSVWRSMPHLEYFVIMQCAGALFRPLRRTEVGCSWA